jgi:trimethylamine--corrinoid protein Co-methyltransferase
MPSPACGFCRRGEGRGGGILRGIVVNDDSLMLDPIDQIGPRGEFMPAKETVWPPMLWDRQRADAWRSAGGKRLGERLRDKTVSL